MMPIEKSMNKKNVTHFTLITWQNVNGLDGISFRSVSVLSFKPAFEYRVKISHIFTELLSWKNWLGFALEDSFRPRA